MSNTTFSPADSDELWKSGGLFELRTVSLDPKVIAGLAEVRVPTPQSVLIGWVDVPAGDPLGATQHALYLTPGGYAYRVTTYAGGRRTADASLN
ncbi:hypothetical protein [Streptomyces sp. NPDC059398]|uniref:hypothetical protein n=1 Tax=Streptomyces sp. NPDC059398 TaxID=3346820 RepID=UPI00368E2B92